MITVYGEGLIDLVPQYSSPMAPLVPALGGGPFNVAIVVARQNRPVAFQSRLSQDPFGQELAGRLSAEGVDITGLQRGPEPSTLAVTSLQADGSATYTFYNQSTADRFVHPTAAPTDIACFGTCSLAWEPGASRYGEVLRAHAAAGRLVALDPNIRPAFATPEHRDRLVGLMESTHLVKLSREEVDFFGGLDRLTACGPQAIIITDGAAGITAVIGTAEVTVPAVRTEVADTIGAGDTVMGTLLAELDRRDVHVDDLASLGSVAWEEILARAARAAAITCSRTGAQPPTAAELDAAG